MFIRKWLPRINLTRAKDLDPVAQVIRFRSLFLYSHCGCHVVSLTDQADFVCLISAFCLDIVGLCFITPFDTFPWMARSCGNQMLILSIRSKITDKSFFFFVLTLIIHILFNGNNQLINYCLDNPNIIIWFIQIGLINLIN